MFSGGIEKQHRTVMQCASGFQPLLKNTTPLFLAKPPLKSANCLVCKISARYPNMPSNPSLKVEVLSSPHPFENLVGGLTPQQKEGAHYAMG